MYAPKTHALFVALPAFGHITPMLELAKKLTHHNFHITFAVSEIKVAELCAREYIPKPYRSSIEVYPLHDGLPADIDTRPSATHQEEMQRAMEGPLGELLESMASRRDKVDFVRAQLSPLKLLVDVVVCDGLMWQPPLICSRRGIPSFAFHTNAPVYLTMIPTDWDKVPLIPDERFLDNYDSSKVPGLCVSFVRHLKKMQIALNLQKAIIVNGFEEMDPELFRRIQNLPEAKKIKFVGPLLQADDDLLNPEKVVLADKVTTWLNKQENRSVMYISFGSMVFPSPGALKILGEVLLSVGTPFIFSLRNSQHQNLPTDMQKQITTQFDQPNSAFLVVPWVQQQRILSHSAINLFLTHCGYNSTLETLAHGVPVVAWPFFVDQPMNADYLGRLGMAIKISNTGQKEDHLLDRDELQAALKLVGRNCASNGGGVSAKNSYYEKAKEMASKTQTALSPGGSSYCNFRHIMELMRQ